jgi:hypothetical protein
LVGWEPDTALVMPLSALLRQGLDMGWEEPRLQP